MSAKSIALAVGGMWYIVVIIGALMAASSATDASSNFFALAGLILFFAPFIGLGGAMRLGRELRLWPSGHRVQCVRVCVIGYVATVFQILALAATPVLTRPGWLQSSLMIGDAVIWVHLTLPLTLWFGTQKERIARHQKKILAMEAEVLQSAGVSGRVYPPLLPLLPSTTGFNPVEAMALMEAMRRGFTDADMERYRQWIVSRSM